MMRLSDRCSMTSLLIAALSLAACGDNVPSATADPDSSPLPDPPDAALVDAAPPDAALVDAAPPDAGLLECEGQPDGTPCGDPGDAECDAPDTCQAGVCESNLAADGTACGDPTETECDAADTCAAGACATNLAADGAPCGDPTDTDCDDPDTCAGGACAANGEPDGTICYDCAGGPGQCATCTSSACDGVTCDLGVPAALAAPTVGGNNHRGYMFDLLAASTVTITSFDVRPLATAPIEIYVKEGTHVGFEVTAGAWTLLGTSAPVVPNGDGSPVPVPLDLDVTIPAGQTAAFYITTNDGATSLNYHNGTSRETVAASDVNLTLFEGTGKDYPFGANFVPRVFEGTIHYEAQLAADALDSSTGTATGADVDSAMFDIAATNAIEEADTLSVELAAGTFDVDVYFRRGTHLGFEGSSAGWQLLASEAGVVSAGGGALTDIPLASPVDIGAGESAAFYVDTGAGQAGLQTDVGAAVGDPAASTADQTLLVGTALAGGFGAAGGPAIFRGTLAYGACLLP